MIFLWLFRVKNSLYFLQIRCHFSKWPSRSHIIIRVNFVANRPISQIPQRLWQILHNAPFCNRNVHTCAYFCSLQNKIWNLPDRSTILSKFIYGKEGKLAGPTQVLPVSVHSQTLILKTVSVTKWCIVGYGSGALWDIGQMHCEIWEWCFVDLCDRSIWCLCHHCFSYWPNPSGGWVGLFKAN